MTIIDGNLDQCLTDFPVLRQCFKQLFANTTCLRGNLPKSQPCPFSLLTRMADQLQTKSLMGCPLVPCYGAFTGRVTSDPIGTEPCILNIDRLRLIDYPRVAKSIAVICREGENVSHLPVLCRLLGKPVVQMNSVTPPLDNQIVTINGLTGTIAINSGEVVNSDIEDDEVSEFSAFIPTAIRWQVSVIDGIQVKNAIKVAPDTGITFFVRHEFFWLTIQSNPFEHAESLGYASFSERLFDYLSTIAQQLRPGDSLNFRSLDLRSNEFNEFRRVQVIETNPTLGDHGIRHMLQEPEMMIAEARAVRAIQHFYGCRVIYSFPFVALAAEVEHARRILDNAGFNDIELGVYVEIPSLETEIPQLIAMGISNFYIGSKDLAALLVSMDRMNPNIMSQHPFTHKRFYRTVSKLLRLCRRSGKPAYFFTFMEHLAEALKMIPEIQAISVCYAEFVYYQTHTLHA